MRLSHHQDSGDETPEPDTGPRGLEIPRRGTGTRACASGRSTSTSRPGRRSSDSSDLNPKAGAGGGHGATAGRDGGGDDAAGGGGGAAAGPARPRRVGAPGSARPAAPGAGRACAAAPPARPRAGCPGARGAGSPGTPAAVAAVLPEGAVAVASSPAEWSGGGGAGGGGGAAVVGGGPSGPGCA